MKVGDKVKLRKEAFETPANARYVNAIGTIERLGEGVDAKCRVIFDVPAKSAKRKDRQGSTATVEKTSGQISWKGSYRLLQRA